ncbi:low temperature requirement A protein (LtrA) [Lentzea xinjiangensis]|uniref:Low temperature requirement A protein (LtrA) n=1 Tax=Lentzea xinjiangensis TaxID=402600 RepID=A0A1H9T3V9_9PSEU|nr:low temperature requirement protein A [Lentzea xinjiangensis]SER91932.1 low temperature requirement A protein (LtrA) [Lentzea xinjiangensis]
MGGGRPGRRLAAPRRVLVVASGIPAVFEDQDYRIVGGYVVIRFAMVAHWLRASRGNPAHCGCPRRYAGGNAFMQVLWVLRVVVAPPSLQIPLWVLFMIGELLVPVWAERSGATTWHPHHITERHGLFTLIVLGESILAATLAFRKGFDSGVTSSRSPRPRWSSCSRCGGSTSRRRPTCTR